MYCQIRHGDMIERGDAEQLVVAEMQLLAYGTILYTRGSCGCLLRVKVNGAPKLWKRSPGRVQIPYKYGLYEHGYFDETDKLYRRRTTIDVWCAWCKEFMHTIDGQGQYGDSHGICPECSEKQLGTTNLDRIPVELGGNAHGRS